MGINQRKRKMCEGDLFKQGNLLKQRLIDASQRAEREGLCMHKSGNFSIFDRNAGKIYITPSGLERHNLTPEDLVVTDPLGNIMENPKGHKPSIELSMHIAAYETRMDANAVVHTHSPYATAFAVKGIPVSPVATEAFFYGKNVELAEYAESGSLQLAANIKEPIKKADVCLLKNHGVLVVADTIENALLKAFYLEDVAKIEAISRSL